MQAASLIWNSAPGAALCHDEQGELVMPGGRLPNNTGFSLGGETGLSLIIVLHYHHHGHELTHDHRIGKTDEIIMDLLIERKTSNPLMRSASYISIWAPDQSVDQNESIVTVSYEATVKSNPSQMFHCLFTEFHNHGHMMQVTLNKTSQSGQTTRLLSITRKPDKQHFESHIFTPVLGNQVDVEDGDLISMSCTFNNTGHMIEQVG